MLIEITSLVEVNFDALRKHILRGCHTAGQPRLLELVESLEAGEGEACAQKAVEGRHLLAFLPEPVQGLVRALLERKRLERLLEQGEGESLNVAGIARAASYPRLRKIEDAEGCAA